MRSSRQADIAIAAGAVEAGAALDVEPLALRDIPELGAFEKIDRSRRVNNHKAHNALPAPGHSSSSGSPRSSDAGTSRRSRMISRAHAFQRSSASSFPGGRTASAFSYDVIASRSQS